MKFLRDNLPNLLTCLNLFCGLIGLVLLAEEGVLALPALCVLLILAGLADFLDGFVARLLDSASAIGKDLDSLADAVTFGVLPGIAGYLAIQHLGNQNFAWLALSTPVFSVIRLARFNNDPGQSDSFTGVPTPANAFFLIFLCERVLSGEGPLASMDMNPLLLASVFLFSSLMLVSPYRIIALKFKKKGFAPNAEKYILLLAGLLLVILFQKDAVPILYILYLLLSFAFSYRQNESKIKDA